MRVMSSETGACGISRDFADLDCEGFSEAGAGFCGRALAVASRSAASGSDATLTRGLIERGAIVLQPQRHGQPRLPSADQEHHRD
jgi:hypothetical protein